MPHRKQELASFGNPTKKRNEFDYKAGRQKTDRHRTSQNREAMKIERVLSVAAVIWNDFR